MTPDRDPLQPWRPKGDEPFLPADPSRHPRPLPDEPAPPAPVEVYWPASEPTYTPPVTLRLDQKAVLICGAALLVAGVVLLLILGAPHVTRLGAAAVCVEAGLFAGLSLARKRSWRNRLAWVGGGVAGAALVWVFLPTTGGINLLEAYRQLAEARNLPVGDVDHFLQTRPRRELLKAQYPSFKPEVDEAERGWFTQTADQAVTKADALLSADPATASDQLQQLDRRIRPVKHYAVVRDRLQAARHRAVLARLQAVRKKAEALASKGRFADITGLTGPPAMALLEEAREVGALQEMADGLAEARRHVVRARIDAARQEVRTLLRANRFVEVAARGAQLGRDVTAEAEAVGLAADLRQFCRACEAFGIVARQAGAKAPK